MNNDEINIADCVDIINSVSLLREDLDSLKAGVNHLTTLNLFFPSLKEKIIKASKTVSNMSEELANATTENIEEILIKHGFSVEKIQKVRK